MATLSTSAAPKQATLYRMVMPTHLCPFGLKARWLLRRHGYHIDDHALRSRAEQDAFKAQHGVKTTPQVFIGGVRVGGYDDLRRFFGLHVKDRDQPSYLPVLAVFAVAACLAVAMTAATGVALPFPRLLLRFVAIATCLLAMLKLQDVDRFATMFLGYDLLARRAVPYAYAYPFAELGVGLAMLAGISVWAWGPVALLIGGVGAVSVFKAVYLDKRSLRCACVGGGSNVPLGFVSLLENVMMVAMAVAALLGMGLRT